MFVEHGRDPRNPPGLDLPPFSVCAVGGNYFRKCGPLATDWDPPACGGGGGFRLIGIVPAGDPGAGGPYEFHCVRINSSYALDLILRFNADVDPATLTTTTMPWDPGIDDVGPPDWSGPESMRAAWDMNPAAEPFGFAVDGGAIRISNANGNRWGSSAGGGGQIWVQLTAGLKDVDGNPLANPGNAATWLFDTDD